VSIYSSIFLPKLGRGRPRAGTEAKTSTRTTASWQFEAETSLFRLFRRLLGRWPGIEFRVEFVDGFEKFDKT
jgi:hypothetical protein